MKTKKKPYSKPSVQTEPVKTKRRKGGGRKPAIRGVARCPSCHKVVILTRKDVIWDGDK